MKNRPLETSCTHSGEAITLNAKTVLEAIKKLQAIQKSYKIEESYLDLNSLYAYRVFSTPPYFINKHLMTS